MLPPTHPDDAAFEEALAGFQDNVATATRCLYAKLALNHFASQDHALLRTLNDAPEFWNLVTGASQTTMFVALGRVFDQGPDARCTLDRLIRIAQAGNGDIFAAHRLADRKRRASPNADEWLGDYLSRIYVPNADDFRALRKTRDRYRKQFEATYRPIRTEVYTHSIASRSKAVELFADTRLNELQRILRFLQRLGDGLWELYWNGRHPLRRQRFAPMSLERIVSRPSPDSAPSDQTIIVEAVREVMQQLPRR